MATDIFDQIEVVRDYQIWAENEALNKPDTSANAYLEHLANVRNRQLLHEIHSKASEGIDIGFSGNPDAGALLGVIQTIQRLAKLPD